MTSETVGLTGLTQAEFDEWLRKSCEASGVPVKLTDPTVIRQVARLMGA